MRLVWSNALTYNRSDSHIFMSAKLLSSIWELEFARVERSIKVHLEKQEQLKARESKEEDRLKFAELLKGLNDIQLGHVVEVVERRCPRAICEKSDVDLEMELYLIDAETLKE